MDVDKWAESQSKLIGIPWLTIIEAFLSLFENCNDSSEQINDAIGHQRKSRMLNARSTVKLSQLIADDCPELSRRERRTKARLAIQDAFSQTADVRLAAIRELRGESPRSAAVAAAAGETT